MEYAYAAADMVISRSGAMAIAELCVVRKPVIFVPYPFAAEDHQTMNAKNLVNAHAAEMIKDNETLQILVPSVVALSRDSTAQESLKHNIGGLAMYDADARIAEAILNELTNKV
ncbi:glycosyltransferase, partial [Neobacillus niacini]|uniref:UDP-N-acetylglucosamine--N-acetylmuramyl- (pentapeptide) pyrophosphoryl-undecaprenol N-acetylglucosamine transferase n=1 Tax=Neobacillus niacini TaxID=86668 RepID=UPI00255A2CEC